MDSPEVYLLHRPHAQAYVVEASGRHHLIITSGMLNLFEQRPDELAFVIGRQLGHIKCDHIALKRASFGIMSTLKTVQVEMVPDQFQRVLAPLMMGRMLSWARAAEMTADRAGLIACGDPAVANQAMLRLLHGLEPDSQWIDPEADRFDAGAVVAQFQQWEDQPLVRLIMRIKKQQHLTHPFVPHRLRALRQWVQGGHFQAILERDVSRAGNLLVSVESVEAFELAPTGQAVDPYVQAFDGDKRFLRTVYGRAVRSARWEDFDPMSPSVQQPLRFRNGQPLFFEIWDRNWIQDTLIGGFVIYPHREDANDKGVATYNADIIWDWKQRRAVARAGYARVKVRFSERAE
jgi:hypothetical protein